MILSSPFSRNSHNTHNLHNQQHHHHKHRYGSLRKPAPLQPAPQQPKPVEQTNGSVAPFRSHTLNRWDLQKSRQQQQQRQQTARSSLQRNSSALGHYPNHAQQPASRALSPIYAPASIASPAELAHYKRPVALNNGESQHYASTSYRGAHSVAGDSSGRSGRESALGNLLERFGTLTRRAKWSRSSRKASATPTIDYLMPRTPPILDPEVYGTGKKKVEAEAIYAEGSRAIDGNGQKRLLHHQLDQLAMIEGETQTSIDENSQLKADYQQLIELLKNWINDELAQQRIIVGDLQEDLYDGQILGKLIEKLHNIKIDIVEVTQNELTQKYKLRTVLDTINRILTLQARWARIRWTVEGIHSKNPVEIVHLLVTLALYYQAPIKLPPDVRVQVLVVKKWQGQLVKQFHEAQLTQSTAEMQSVPANSQQQRQRDAFDTLIEFAPDKLNIVKKSLVNFVNRHLSKINMSCGSIAPSDVLDPDQFSDGLLLVFLIASLEEYFVPLGNLFTTNVGNKLFTIDLSRDSESKQLPDLNNNISTAGNFADTAIEPDNYINSQPIYKLHNVNVAFQLIEDAGIAIHELVRAEDIVNGDLKAVLRVLYALFSRYKHV